MSLPIIIRCGAIMAALAVCTACAHASEAANVQNPETTVCPPMRGDLESGIYTMMMSGNFERWAGNMSWRRRVDGPFHPLSLENAQWLHVRFDTIRTSQGTRLIADLTWRTSSYEFAVKETEITEPFQDILDEVANIFPCAG